MTTAVRGQRLFFALWPDPAARAALVRLQDGVAGKLTPPEKLHLTLVFLGQQEAHALAPLRAILDSVPAQAVTLEFDTYGYFRAPRIAWAGMRSTPPALPALHAALLQRLSGQQLPLPAAGPFRPHVTLARQAPGAPLAACAPWRWRADTLALVESCSASGRYQVLAARRLD